MTVHIHAPQPDHQRLVYTRCPTCNANTFRACFHVPWYGWDSTCLRCGERWEDGERLSRPFMPRWRKLSIQRARNRFGLGG